MYTTRIRAMWQCLNNNSNFTRSANVYPPNSEYTDIINTQLNKDISQMWLLILCFLKCVCVCPTVSAGDLKTNSKRLSRCEKEREQ